MAAPVRTPAYQFYPAEWISSRHVRKMVDAQRGWYHQLLAEAWLCEPQCGLPDDEAYLKELAAAVPRVPDLTEQDIIILAAQIVEAHRAEVEKVITQLISEGTAEITQVAANNKIQWVTSILCNSLRDSADSLLRQCRKTRATELENDFDEKWQYVMARFKIMDENLRFNRRQLEEREKQTRHRANKAKAGEIGAGVTNSKRKELSDSVDTVSRQTSDSDATESQQQRDRESSPPRQTVGSSSSSSSSTEKKEISLRSTKKKSRGERIPNDFELTAHRFQLAQLYLEKVMHHFIEIRLGEMTAHEKIADIFLGFKNHWQASAKPEAWKNDWDGAWVTWYQKAKKILLEEVSHNGNELRGAAAAAELLRQDRAAEERANASNLPKPSTPLFNTTLNSDDDLNEFKLEDEL